MTPMRWLVALAMLVVAAPAIAADPAGLEAPTSAVDDADSTAVPAARAPHLEYDLFLYVWIPGQFGTVDVKGRTAHLDVTVKDALDTATSGNSWVGSGYFGVRYDRFSAFIDAWGGYARVAARVTVPLPRCTVDVAGEEKVKPVFVDFAVGYELGRWIVRNLPHPVTLGVYAGMRYTHFGVKLNASVAVPDLSIQRSAAVETAYNWADPMIGVRWEVPLLESLTADFRG